MKILYAVLIVSCLSDLSNADSLSQAVAAYDEMIEGNEKAMKLFIPFSSFFDKNIVRSFYGCGQWKEDEFCTGKCCKCDPEICAKSWMFPVFYIALPAVHITGEVLFTATARLFGLPYLCYLWRLNQEAKAAKGFLEEITTYQTLAQKNDKEQARNYVLNTVYLFPAFRQFKQQCDPVEVVTGSDYQPAPSDQCNGDLQESDDKISLSDFVGHVNHSLATNQYNFQGKLYSIEGFINASVTIQTNDGEVLGVQ